MLKKIPALMSIYKAHEGRYFFSEVVVGAVGVIVVAKVRVTSFFEKHCYIVCQ